MGERRAQETKGGSEAPCRTHAFPSDSLSRSLSLSLPLHARNNFSGLSLPPFSRLPFDASAGKNNNPLLGPPLPPPLSLPKDGKMSPSPHFSFVVGRCKSYRRRRGRRTVPPLPPPGRDVTRAEEPSGLALSLFFFAKKRVGCSAKEEEKRRLF